jgi:hypothetical protein
MAAEITSNGIQFSDSTNVNSRGWMTPDGTAMFFYQASAPTHWVKSTSHDNKMLRVLSGTGGGSGGNFAFAGLANRVLAFNWSSSSPTDNRTLNSNQIPAHTHSDEGTSLNFFNQNPNGTYNGGDVRRGPGWTRSFNATGGVSGPAQHNHPFSAGGTRNIGMNIDVQYVDCIQCNFDINA